MRYYACNGFSVVVEAIKQTQTSTAFFMLINFYTNETNRIYQRFGELRTNGSRKGSRPGCNHYQERNPKRGYNSTAIYKQVKPKLNPHFNIIFIQHWHRTQKRCGAFFISNKMEKNINKIEIKGQLPPMLSDLFNISQRAENEIKRFGTGLNNYYDNEMIKQAVTSLRLTIESVIIKNGGAV